MRELRIPVSVTADSAANTGALTSAIAHSAQGAETLTSANAVSAQGAEALTTSAGADSARGTTLTSAEAKALLFRVQLAEEQRQAALASQKGGKSKGPILGGQKRTPKYRP
jgi:transcription initiation factor IIF auxiliary subunit